MLVGPDKLLDPRQVKKVWVSPRQRALRTFQLLFGDLEDTSRGEGGTGRQIAGVSEEVFGGGEGSIKVTEQIREWDYGEYEGMMAADVRKLRKEKGLDRDGLEWSVWRDGCEGGEYVYMFHWSYRV